jgi:hypothetical protein
MAMSVMLDVTAIHQAIEQARPGRSPIRKRDEHCGLGNTALKFSPQIMWRNMLRFIVNF